MRRGEVWWAALPAPAGRRPVLLCSREEAYAVRALVTVAPVTTRVRGIAVEVPLGSAEGLPRPCAANCDSLTTVPKVALVARAGRLSPTKTRALDTALRFALGLGG